MNTYKYTCTYIYNNIMFRTVVILQQPFHIHFPSVFLLNFGILGGCIVFSLDKAQLITERDILSIPFYHALLSFCMECNDNSK